MPFVCQDKDYCQRAILKIDERFSRGRPFIGAPNSRTQIMPLSGVENQCPRLWRLRLSYWPFSTPLDDGFTRLQSGCKASIGGHNTIFADTLHIYVGSFSGRSFR